MSPYPFIIAMAIMVLLTTVLVVGYRSHKKALARESEKYRQKQQQLAAFSAELKNLKKELARKSEIAEKLPHITKKMTEKLPSDTYPTIAVRSIKEFFHAGKVGYFALAEGSSDYTLVVEAGFPPDWLGKVRIHLGEGIPQRKGADMWTSNAIPEGRHDNRREGNGSRPAGMFRRARIVGAFALILLLPAAGFAAEPAPADTPAKEAVAAVDNLLITTPPPPPNVRTPVLAWGEGNGKSYSIPAWDILGFEALLNVYGRIVYPDLVDPQYSNGKKVYSVTLETIKDHILHGPWGFDGDDFQVNQLQHPYQGSVYHGFARSAGLGFWPSAAYTFLGSLVWEIAGETTNPSINDQVASGIGGSLLGEPLFRLSSLILEDGGDHPGFWRELGAAVISPPTGFNRLAFGDRFKGVFPSHNPATFTRLRLGASLTDHLVGISDNNVDQKEVTADYSLSYGLPGKDGYTYDRPFDYFHFEFTAVSGKNGFENLMTRGLLFGKKYEAGENYRGIWGLYGSFDYISPQVFRVSSTALSLGTTGQWWLTRAVALQGSALAGVGYGAAGSVHPTEERDYHYGGTGQGLLGARLIFGDKAMFDMTAREYYISGLGSTQTDGSERIFRGNASFTVSVYKGHALGIQYVMSQRDASSPDRPGTHQTVGTWSLAYNYLGDSRFGAVEWRPAEIEGR